MGVITQTVIVDHQTLGPEVPASSNPVVGIFKSGKFVSDFGVRFR